MTMMTLYLYQRLTHRYRDGWADSDDWRYVSTARMTPWRIAQEPRDYDDGGTSIAWLTVDRADPALVRQAIIDTLGGSRCRHEYDCCGCAFHRVDARRLSRRQWLVHRSTGFNL